MGPLQKEYQYFLVLCESLSISRAAEVLGMQQGSLSKSLKKLESSLEEKLFIRKGRGLLLTDFGRMIQGQVLEVSEKWQQDLSEKRQNLGELSGQFKIGTHSTIAVDHLSTKLPRLAEKYQRINLDLVFKRSNDITRDILNFELDFGFVANPIPHPSLIIKKLNKEFVSAWCKNPIEHKKVIYYNPEMIQISKLLKKYTGYKHFPIKDYEVLASFAAKSNGVCILPSPVAARYKSLKQLGPKLVEINLCLVCHSERPKTPAFRTLLKELAL